jgi:NADPH2:quinone reductase
MRVLQFEQFGDPLEVLKLKEVPDLQPRDNEVRIKVTYRTINPSDLYFIWGDYGITPKLPATPGFEGTGYIDAVGAQMKKYQMGQRVVPLGVAGTWKEQMLLKKGEFLPIPDELSDQAAAQLVINPSTAWILCTEELPLKKGEWLLQTAAGSTLGRMVLQISELRGFKTINFVRRRAQVQELLDLGADTVICTGDKDVVEQVLQITRKGVHAAIDAVGGRTGALAAQCLRAGGTLIVYGLLSRERTPIDTGDMIFKETIIRGFWLNSWFRKIAPGKILSTFTHLLELMTSKQITPPVDAIYDLLNFKAAIKRSLESGRQGKVLLGSQQ